MSGLPSGPFGVWHSTQPSTSVRNFPRVTGSPPVPPGPAVPPWTMGCPVVVVAGGRSSAERAAQAANTA